MKRKPAKLFRMAPLQRIKAREITDAAEQAAVEAEIKRRELAAARAANGEGSVENSPPRKPGGGKARKGS
jgi:hypothetical protein